MLVEVTFFSEETNDVKKKKVLCISDSFDSYEAENILETLVVEILEEEYPGYANLD